MAERKVVLLKVLLLLSASAPLSSAVGHCLRFYYTALTPGLDFRDFTVEGLVDGEPFVTFDSRTQKWIYQIEADHPKLWKRNTQDLENEQKKVRDEVVEGLKSLGSTGGEDTVQWMFGCGLDDDGTKTGFWNISYGGEDFSLELKNDTWITKTDKSEEIKQNLEKKKKSNGYRKAYLENKCNDWLQKFVKDGLSKGSRKRWSLDGCKERQVAGPSAVPPKVSLFQKDSSSPVVCHATGFFPKSVTISWEKNGVELHEDVDLRETLPNEDGSFNKSSVLTVSPEDLNRNNYTCVVHHSSLKEPLVSDRVLPGGDAGGGSTGIIGVVVALLLVLVGCVGLFIWKKRAEKHQELESESKSSGSEEAKELNPKVSEKC